MGAIVEVAYFNTFLNKDVGTNVISNSGAPDDYEDNGVWPALPWDPVGYPIFPNGANNLNKLPYEWYVEESRIRGGFNNTSVQLGPRAYISEDNDNVKEFTNSIIYSGIFNSKTDVNNTNVFSVAESITKSLDPRYGNIQFIYARDTDLTVFQQNKVNRVLIDKDAIYSAEGTSTITTAQAVIGTVTPYEGDYGISNQPESFARYGFRRYFSDVNRGAIMRLSRDGLTEISQYGMSDYFRDQLLALKNVFKIYSADINVTNVQNKIVTLDDVSGLTLGMQLQFNNSAAQVVYLKNIDYITKQITVSENVSDSPTLVTATKQVKDKVLGAWDAYNKQYVLSIQRAATTPTEVGYNTLNFDDSINGWVSFFTYKPTEMRSLKTVFYSFNGIDLYQHNYPTALRNSFYQTAPTRSKIEFVFNTNPSAKKVFKTINYEGYSGWEATSIISDETGPDGSSFYTDTVNPIPSYEEGLYTNYEGYPARAGFDRKENLYVANLINNSPGNPDEIIFGSDMTGIKGYFATVVLQTDSTTDVGGPKELFSVGANVIPSS